MTLKDHVKGISKFQYYNNETFWYRTDTNILFPVPADEVVGAKMDAEFKSIYFMKWIKRQLALILSS